MVVPTSTFAKRDGIDVPVPPVSIQPIKGARDTSEFATFVVLPGCGKGHQIRLAPTEEENVQIPGEKGTRRVPKQGTGIKVRFVEGQYSTWDPGIIESLLTNPKYGFGVHIDINRHDPTGYWKKSGLFEIRTHEVVEVVGPAIGQGALNSRVAKVA